MSHQVQTQTAAAETLRTQLPSFAFGTDAALLAYQLRAEGVNHTVSGITTPEIAGAFAEDLHFAASTAGGFRQPAVVDCTDIENYKGAVRELRERVADKQTDLIVISGLNTFIDTMKNSEDESRRHAFFAVGGILGKHVVPQVCAVTINDTPADTGTSASARLNEILGRGRHELFARDYHFKGYIRPEHARIYLSEHMKPEVAKSTVANMSGYNQDQITIGDLERLIATRAAEA